MPLREKMNGQTETTLKSFSDLFRFLCLKYGLCVKKSSKIVFEERNLEVTVDRLTSTEWVPLLEALHESSDLKNIILRSQSCSTYASKGLNQFEKMFMNSNPSSGLNIGIKRKLCIALKHLLKSSPCLQCLIFENIKLNLEEIQILKEGLMVNKSLQHLSFEKCFLGDKGFNELCLGIKTLPQVISVNFSDCNLTWKAMDNLKNIIHSQNMRRHEETWKNSLRSQFPHLNEMNGLRQIILSHNPGIGDRGVLELIPALADDLWIKVLDLEYCGVTDEGANKLFHVLSARATAIYVFLENNPVQENELLLKFECDKKEVFRKVPVLYQYQKERLKTSTISKKSFDPSLKSKVKGNSISKNPRRKKINEKEQLITTKATNQNRNEEVSRTKLQQENEILKNEIKDCRILLEAEIRSRIEAEMKLQQIRNETNNQYNEAAASSESIFSQMEGIMKMFNDFLTLTSELRLKHSTVNAKILDNKDASDSLKRFSNEASLTSFKEVVPGPPEKEWTTLSRQSRSLKPIHLMPDNIQQKRNTKANQNDFQSLYSHENKMTDNSPIELMTTQMKLGVLLTPRSITNQSNVIKWLEEKKMLNSAPSDAFPMTLHNEKLSGVQESQPMNFLNFPVKKSTESSSTFYVS